MWQVYWGDDFLSIGRGGTYWASMNVNLFSFCFSVLFSFLKEKHSNHPRSQFSHLLSARYLCWFTSYLCLFLIVHYHDATFRCTMLFCYWRHSGLARLAPPSTSAKYFILLQYQSRGTLHRFVISNQQTETEGRTNRSSPTNPTNPKVNVSIKSSQTLGETRVWSIRLILHWPRWLDRRKVSHSYSSTVRVLKLLLY